MKTICLTGGGTLGHITPNLALTKLLKHDAHIIYIGSKNGMEGNFSQELGEYHAISCGKLHRYFTTKNFFMPFVTLKGIFESLVILYKKKPKVVFTSGGYVGLPVVLSAFFLRIPVILYDADMSSGLANRIAAKFAKIIFVNFAALHEKIQSKYKTELVGPFIRKEFQNTDPASLRRELGFSSTKPILLIFGGSQGSEFINDVIIKIKYKLLLDFQIIHVFGKGKVRENQSSFGYKVFENISENFADYMDLADIVISRAGASTITELLFLKKPHILIPMSLRASRGDQEQNANYFAKKNVSIVMHEKDCNPDALIREINNLWKKREQFIKAMEALQISDATPKVAKLLLEISGIKIT